MAFVQAIALGYARYGKDPAGALAAAQIPAAWLADPSARITASQMEKVSEHAMRELDDEALGWFERPLPWGSYGLLARASISSPTLGVALQRWCRHHGLLTHRLALRLQTDASCACITLEEREDLGPMREFCQVSVLRNVLGLASWLIDSRLPLHAAAFRGPRPPHADAYAVLFPTPTPTAFNAPLTEVRFDARYLPLPLQRDEQALRHMLQHALPLMVQPYRRDRLLVARARQLLITQAPQAHSAASLARQLHVSTRTLHRQLHEQGHSLQGLKDAVRRDLAIDLLLRTRQPIKQVAQAVGYQNEKSFIRAFRQWSGEPPSAYRQRHRVHGTVTDGA
jgi:AraC-like DNA-binding protein